MNTIRKQASAVLLAASLLFVATPQAEAKPNKTLVHSLIVKYFPASQVNKAMRVARCESNYNPKAVNRRNRNGTHDVGVFQLNTGGTMQSLGVTYETALHAETNVRAAAKLWKRRGWQPWVCAGKV